MNDRRFPVPYGLLAGLSSATSLPWAAMMNASRALLGGMCPMVAPAAAEKPKRAARAVAATTTAVSIKSPPKKVRKAPAKA